MLNLEGRCLALIKMLISWAVHCIAFFFFFLIKSSGTGYEKLSCQVVSGLMHVNVII